MIDALIFFWTWMLANPLLSTVLVAAFLAGLIAYVRAATAAHQHGPATTNR